MSRKLLPNPWPFRPPSNLRLVDVRSTADLPPHADAWAELLLQSPAASPMLSYPLISAFYETQILPEQSWLCLFAYQDERLVGVLPLVAVRLVGVLGFSILCLKTPNDIMHTGSVDCLTVNGQEDILELFVAYLSCIPRTWPLIRLRDLSDQSPSMVYMSRSGRKLRAVVRPTGGENYIEVPRKYDEFHSRLSSNFKRQLKRSGKKAQELPDLQVHCREHHRSTAENMKRFEDVEGDGWKQGTSIKSVASNARFYALAAERFRDFGWMHWNFVETGDKTIAGHYGVRIKRTLFLLKIGYDEQYSAYSPGNLLLEKAIEDACHAGDVDEINCVSDCAWHSNWGMKKRLRHDMFILPVIPVVSGLLERVFEMLPLFV